jgi:hypothetical protein
VKGRGREGGKATRGGKKEEGQREDGQRKNGSRERKVAEHNHTRSTTASVDNLTVQHEESDVNVRAIFVFAAALLVTALVVHVGVWFLFDAFAERESTGAPPAPLAARQGRLPPQPRLQITPREDLREFRAEEDVRLNSYQWVNKEAGVVRIPIADAVRLTLERGLPTRERQGGTP